MQSEVSLVSSKYVLVCPSMGSVSDESLRARNVVCKTDYPRRGEQMLYCISIFLAAAHRRMVQRKQDAAGKEVELSKQERQQQ